MKSLQPFLAPLVSLLLGVGGTIIAVKQSSADAASRLTSVEKRADEDRKAIATLNSEREAHALNIQEIRSKVTTIDKKIDDMLDTIDSLDKAVRGMPREWRNPRRYDTQPEPLSPP